MGLTLAEQETIIGYDRESKFMNVYTADPYLMARLDKLPKIYHRYRVCRQDGKIISADYRAEKRFCTLRRKDSRKAGAGNNEDTLF